jgi:transposase
MDGHQDALAVAYITPEHGAEVTSLGPIGTRPCALDHLLRQRPSKATALVVVDEAGPCGSWRYRDRPTKGPDGWVVAPSRLPPKAGDRVKTDRRDAGPLARLARSGALPVVDGPTVAAAARRDLTRARAETRSDRQDTTFRLPACGLRHDLRDTGRATWSPAPLRWRSAGVGPTPAHHRVFHAEVRAVHDPTARLQRLDQARHAHVHAWHVHPVVEALQALRGVPCPVAGTRVAARGDRTRGETPSALMNCLGLLPSAESSGAHRRQGPMTTAGTTPARRALVEGAWASRDPAQGSRPLPRRLAPPPPILQDRSGKAQVKRCQRDRRLVSRGQHAPVVTVAIARD